MPWKKLLASATGQIDEALRQKLEFVLEGNRVYRALLDRQSPHWRLQDAERKVLTEKGKPLGKLLHDVITLVQPETLLKWHRRLVGSKWDFAHRRKPKPGRPSVSVEMERLVLQFARENPGWGYDRIVGALGIWGSSTNDVYIIGALASASSGPRSGRAYHFDGNNWSRLTDVGIIHPLGVWGTSSNDVWICGLNGSLLHAHQTKKRAVSAKGSAIHHLQ